MRLIDADALRQAILSMMPERSEVLLIVDNQPEAVVRCKNCDNRECDGRVGAIVCGIDGTPHRPDWFCADGERKEGE